MADILVKIANIVTGETVDAELPDDARVGDLKPALAEKLGWQPERGGATSYKLGYKYPNPPEPYEFADDDTLAGRDVKPGSILSFIKEFIAGS